MYRARLLVVDSYDLMRIGLKIVLGRDASLEVVGEAKDSSEGTSTPLIVWCSKIGFLSPRDTLLTVTLRVRHR